MFDGECEHLTISQVTGLAPAADGPDPEEAVVLGAAVHAGILQGSSGGMEMADSGYVAELHSRRSAMLLSSEWQP